MTLYELETAVNRLIQDAQRNGVDPSDVEVNTITDRGTVKPLKGYRPYDVRTAGPVLLTK